MKEKDEYMNLNQNDNFKKMNMNIFQKENDYYMKHELHTEHGSSGGPILSQNTNWVIGIHKAAKKLDGEYKYNIGTFLKFPLNELKNSKGRKVSYNNYYII